MKAEWQKLRSKDCVDSFTADELAYFSPGTCCLKHKQHDNTEPGLSRREFGCTEMVCLCSKTYCCYDVTSNKLKFSSNLLSIRLLEQSSYGPLENYLKLLNERVNVTSNNKGFRTNNHSVGTHEKFRKICPTLHTADGRRWWNSLSTSNFVRISLIFHFTLSYNCPTLYLLINVFIWKYLFFHSIKSNQYTHAQRIGWRLVRFFFIASNSFSDWCFLLRSFLVRFIVMGNTCCIFFAITLFPLLLWSFYNLYVSSRLPC